MENRMIENRLHTSCDQWPGAMVAESKAAHLVVDDVRDRT